MIAETKIELFKLLTQYYCEHHLNADLKHSVFEDEARSIYWYPSNKYSDSIYYQVRLTYTHPDIQRIQNEVFPNISNFTVLRVTGMKLQQELGVKSKKYIYNPDFLIEGNIHLYVLREHESPVQIFEDHQSYMDEIGLLFFEKLKSLKSIDQFINDPILEDPLVQLTPEKIIILKNKSLKQEVLAGIIAAYLIDQDRARQLMENYEILYEGNNFILRDVRKLKNHLSFLT